MLVAPAALPGTRSRSKVELVGDVAEAPPEPEEAGAMYARSSTFQTDPARVDAGIGYVRDEVVPALERLDGCTGLSLIANREKGRLIVTAGWRDEDAMRASEEPVRGLRARGGEVMQAVPTVDVWEIAVLHRVHDVGLGASLRAFWTRADAARVDRAVDSYKSVVLPQLEQLPGFCSASLFVDRASGRAVSSVTYASRQEMVDSREAGSSMRRTAVEENDLRLLEVVEFDVEIAALRVPETV